MGMIRVSDQVEEQLKTVADGRSMSATIEKMLAYCSSPEGFCPAPQDTGNYEPYLLEQMNKRFDELSAAINDLMVEGAASAGVGAPKKFQGEPTWVEWEQMQYIIFELLEDDAREWRISKGAIRQLKEGSSLDDAAYTIRDGVIFIDDSPIITVSPRVQEAIDDKKVYE